MKRIRDNTYIMRDFNKRKLTNLGFRYLSKAAKNDIEYEIYTYRFPVYKYKNITTLECEISIETHNGYIMSIDVYDANHNVYTAFYFSEYGNHSDILKTISKRIMEQFKKLGIEKVKT